MIYIVEDDEVLRDLMCAIISRTGAPVRSIGPDELDGIALGALAEVRLVIMDISLGSGRNGFSVAGELRENNPGLKVLFTSGFSHADLPESELANEHFLQKPFTIDALLAAIERATN